MQKHFSELKISVEIFNKTVKKADSLNQSYKKIRKINY